MKVDWNDINSVFLFLGNEIHHDSFNFYIFSFLFSLNSL